MSQSQLKLGDGTGGDEVPVAFTWSGVGAAARSLLSRGSVYYDLAGRMRVATTVGERQVTIREDGTVGIRDLVR